MRQIGPAEHGLRDEAAQRVTTAGSLEGRVAFVTGAAMGIGHAIAAVFVERGARVIIADIDNDGGQRTAASLGPNAAAEPCDVTRAPSIDRAIDATVARFGRLDVVVNNAGVVRDGMLHKLSEDEWDLVISVNLKGAFLVTRSAARYLRQPGQSGAIVNISSLAAKAGNLGQANYVAAKAGLVGLTKTSARELARYSVRVNAVQPGFIDTAMTRVLPDDVKQQRLKEIPLGRAGTVDEVARVVAFLASDEASYVTGAVIEVAGGRWM